jgi:hypothetical protein
MRPRRRVWLLLGSLLAMVVCAGGFTLVYLRSDAGAQVLAVVRPVTAGQALASADVQAVRVAAEGRVRLVAASQLTQVIGRTAAVPLTAGTLLSDAQLGPAQWPPPGAAVVAVPVKTGRLAAGVVPGARVLVIPGPQTTAGSVAAEPGAAASAPPVSRDGSAGDSAAPGSSAPGSSAPGSSAPGAAEGPVPVPATVVALGEDPGGTGVAVVSLLVQRDRLVTAAGSGAEVSIALARD